jgi:hypothetical protein
MTRIKMPSGNCWHIVVNALLSLSLLCHYGVAANCGHEPQIVLPGDVILGGFFAVQQQGVPDAACHGQVSLSTVQRVEAFLFAIKRLNTDGFIPGIKFGA